MRRYVQVSWNKSDIVRPVDILVTVKTYHDGTYSSHSRHTHINNGKTRIYVGEWDGPWTAKAYAMDVDAAYDLEHPWTVWLPQKDVVRQYIKLTDWRESGFAAPQ